LFGVGLVFLILTRGAELILKFALLLVRTTLYLIWTVLSNVWKIFCPTRAPNLQAPVAADLATVCESALQIQRGNTYPAGDGAGVFEFESSRSFSLQSNVYYSVRSEAMPIDGLAFLRHGVDHPNGRAPEERGVSGNEMALYFLLALEIVIISLVWTAFALFANSLFSFFDDVNEFLAKM
ncbi:hypothetical protein SCHPADRAFT_897238, partial [Schizopora paradoxa]